MASERDAERARLEADLANADAAVAEIEAFGATDRRCLRCGGALSLDDRGSGYTVSCPTANCLRLTLRGI